jgi:predicted nuclease of predicted toxin-antitoxin system
VNILIDMNLSPAWVQVLREAGYDAVHWMNVGDCSAPDTDILRWAAEHAYVVFTHDLDFGSILAATKTKIPSVLQIRFASIHPDEGRSTVIAGLRAFERELASGALVSLEPERARVRILPIE